MFPAVARKSLRARIKLNRPFSGNRVGSSDRLSAPIRCSAVCFILRQPRAQIKKEIRAKFQLSYGLSGGFSPFSLRRKKKKKKERKGTSAKPGWQQCTILGTILNAAEVTIPISSFGVVICTGFLLSYCSSDQKKILSGPRSFRIYRPRSI